MKKAFLSSTSPITLLRPSGKTREAAPPAPEEGPKEKAQEKDPRYQKPDRSAHLMAQAVAMAMIRLHGLDPEDFIYGMIKKDGKNGFTYMCRKDAGDADRKKIMGRIGECLQDLDDRNISPQIAVSPNKATIVCGNKMALYELLENYFEENEAALLTVDSFQEAAFSQTGGIAAFAKEACELFSETDAEIQLLGLVEPRPYLSRAHYEASMMGGHYAHVKLSMQHIRQTIEQEDGLSRDRNRHNHLVFGGYH